MDRCRKCFHPQLLPVGNLALIAASELLRARESIPPDRNCSWSPPVDVRYSLLIQNLTKSDSTD